MALHYPSDRIILALKNVEGNEELVSSNNRLSDLKRAVYGGRGGITDEMAFLSNAYNTITAKERLSDFYVNAQTRVNAEAGINRADQAKRLYYEYANL